MLVLIVDDEAPITHLVGTVVAQAGHTPMLAFHGRQGMEQAHEHWPAMVITDLMMPFMDGRSLISAIRREAAATGQDVPRFVVMTAAPPPAASSLHADMVLTKPFEITELEALLQCYSA